MRIAILSVTILVAFFSSVAAFKVESTKLLIASAYEHGLFARLLPAEAEVAQAKLVFVGDILLARDVERTLHQYGPSYVYQHVGDAFNGAEAVFANFEAAIPKKHIPTPNNTVRFSVATSNVPALAQAGITHASLANNHTLDMGTGNLVHTADVLKDAGIVPFGHPQSLLASSTSMLKRGETVIAVTAVHATPGHALPTKSNEYFAALAENSDLQIVYIHWGDEYQLTHNKTQAKQARALIDAGVDLIIGHHPHVVQDIEVYKNKLIVYSLGNFIFDQYFSVDVEQGLLLALEETADDGWELQLVPVTSAASKNAPQVMSDRERAIFLTALAKRSSLELKEQIAAGVVSLDAELAISPQIE